MAITALPPAPTSSDPNTFETEADTFLAAFPALVTEINAVAEAMDLNDTTDTSASSVAIGTGSKTFTVSAGKSFIPGMFLVIADSAAPTTNYMVCQVVSYSSTTLTLTSKYAIGSGTKSSWNISFSSAPAVPLTGNAKTIVYDENGYGSTNTKIRRFTTTLTDTLSSYADSATLGASFTIPASGIYSISYTDADNTTGLFGVTLNGTTPTTSFVSIAQSEILISTNSPSAYGANCAIVTYLTSGDVLRCHSDGTMQSTSNLARFTLERLF